MLYVYTPLRDKGFMKYKLSLLDMTNTNIHNGPIFFNCYPDLCIDLSYPMTPQALKLDVNEFYDFKNFAIMYYAYFRMVSTNLNTKFLNPLPSNPKETILVQIEDDKPQVFTPKLFKWVEVATPQSIELEDA